jgi:hypothetical protein
LREQGEALFGDEKFADLFQDVGRRSVAPRIVATVMVMQRLEGLSDREAVEHFAFDIRWKYATGVDLDYPSFVHVISIVDPEARHGHKTAARGFDRYKGHVAIDPDSEIITATEVTAGNAGDATAAEVLLADVLPPNEAEASLVPQKTETSAATVTDSEPLKVYGDASYGTAELVERLDSSDIEANVKVQRPSAREGMFSQDEFRIDKPNAHGHLPPGHRGPTSVQQGGSRAR